MVPIGWVHVVGVTQSSVIDPGDMLTIGVAWARGTLLTPIIAREESKSMGSSTSVLILLEVSFIFEILSSLRYGRTEYKSFWREMTKYSHSPPKIFRYLYEKMRQTLQRGRRGASDVPPTVLTRRKRREDAKGKIGANKTRPRSHNMEFRLSSGTESH